MVFLKNLLEKLVLKNLQPTKESEKLSSMQRVNLGISILYLNLGFSGNLFLESL